MKELIISRAEAERLDVVDPLRGARDAFVIPSGVTYLVGHSLGPATHSALENVAKASSGDWANGLVGSWNSANWFELAKRVGARLSRLVGADPDEVMVCDSVSVNLFKLTVAALPLVERKRVLVSIGEFPTDQYIANAIGDVTGAEVMRMNADEELTELSQGGVLIKSAVDFRTAERCNMAEYEAVAAKAGAVIVWDLSHATGVLALDLHESRAQFAVGCTYKYLNGGPGAPAFVYVRDDRQNEVQTPLPGWMGHATPFAFNPKYTPTQGAAQFAAGTPAILSLSALEGALDVFETVLLKDLERKAGQLGDISISHARAAGLTVSSPVEAVRRGGHVSVRVENGYAVVQALAAQGVQADFRTPDTIRFGCSPLFISHVKIWDAMQSLQTILQTRAWDRPQFHTQSIVT